jgi:hypothetical protein
VMGMLGWSPTTSTTSGGEQVKLRATVDQQMPPTPSGLVVRAALAAPVRGEAVLDAAVSGR